MGYVPLYGNDWNVKRGQYDDMKRYLDNYAWHMGVNPEDLGYGEDVHLTIDPQDTTKSGGLGIFRERTTNGNVDERELVMAAPLGAGINVYGQRSWPSIFSHEMFHYQDEKAPTSEVEKYAQNDKYLAKMFGNHWPLEETTARGADAYFDLISKPGPHSMESYRVVDKPGGVESYVKDDNTLGVRVRKATHKQVPVDAGISQETYQAYHDFFNRLYPNRKSRY
tara:strand:- start:1141 stop:1809 length:669 start_codon:yes stop_codon:yes gene_type:complete